MNAIARHLWHSITRPDLALPRFLAVVSGALLVERAMAIGSVRSSVAVAVTVPIVLPV